MNMRAAIGAKAETWRLEVVTSAERLAAIGAEWTRLWEQCDALIFQSHGWISAWWSTAKNAGRPELRIGLVWNGDRLEAILPLAITRRTGLRFLEWAAAAYSDYGDTLLAPDCPESALEKLWARICDTGGFDLALIGRLRPGTPAERLFAPGKTGKVMLRAHYRREVSSRISGTWPSGAAWLAERPKKPRQNYRRGLKALEDAGSVRIRLLDQDESLGPVLDRLTMLKRKWLARTERSSALFDDGGPALAALVGVLSRAGILRVFVIELDGVIVAISVNFVQHDTMMAWVTTYDPEFARASPGMVLIFEYIQWAFDHGLGMVDLLCGGEAFKDRLSTDSVVLGSVIGSRTLKGSLALFAYGMRHRFRQARAKKAGTGPAAG